MTKPVPGKAEVAVEYPDKLYIGTFAHTARFESHLDETGISLTLERPGADDERKSVHMHFHFALFAEILRDLANTVASVPQDDISHREALRDAAEALYRALQSQPARND
jgi:catechol-2,3-dioxygenase